MRTDRVRLQGEHRLTEDRAPEPDRAQPAAGHGLAAQDRWVGFLWSAPSARTRSIRWRCSATWCGSATYYQRYGFPDARVTYDVAYDAEPDLVEITYHVREGPPLQLADAALRGAGQRAPEPRARAGRALGRVHPHRGQRSADGSARRSGGCSPIAPGDGSGTVAIPFAAVEANVLGRHGREPRRRHGRGGARDARPGPRRSRSPATETVPDRQFARQLPISQGDWYDANSLEQGRQQLSQLSTVRLALINVPRRQRERLQRGGESRSCREPNRTWSGATPD